MGICPGGQTSESLGSSSGGARQSGKQACAGSLPGCILWPLWKVVLKELGVAVRGPLRKPQRPQPPSLSPGVSAQVTLSPNRQACADFSQRLVKHPAPLDEQERGDEGWARTGPRDHPRHVPGTQPGFGAGDPFAEKPGVSELLPALLPALFRSSYWL